MEMQSSSGDAAYILKIKRVPKRYVVEREPTGLTSIRFGSRNFNGRR